MKSVSTFLPTLWNFSRSHLSRLVRTPVVPVATPMLRPAAASLARRVARFGRTVERVLISHREAVLDRQYIQERIADAAISLVTSACTLSRWDQSLVQNSAATGSTAAELYLRIANRRFDDALWQLNHNDDRLTSAAAGDALRLYANYESLR